VALGCAIVARSNAGAREIPIRQFFRGAMETALAVDECLTMAHFPVWPDEGRIGTGFQEVSARRSDFALVAAAAQLQLDASGACRRAALGVGGAGPVPMLLESAAERLLGTRLTDADLAGAARTAEAALESVADIDSSATYRRRVAGEMVQRALTEAKSELSPGNT
jgi:CO/xanthine dehydrogenase FAD-binding subunit